MTKRSQRGFSLIELMVTVAIIGILASVAYPSYRKTVMKSYRTDARTQISKLSQLLEKCYTQYSSYNHASCAAATPYPFGSVLPAGTTLTPDGRYRIDVTWAAASTSQTYTIRATAQGSQANDTGCTSLTLTNANVKSPSACW